MSAPKGKGRAKKYVHDLTCSACRGQFTWTTTDPAAAKPTVCGQHACQTALWGAEEWAGRKRMAEARSAAAAALDEIDERALVVG